MFPHGCTYDEDFYYFINYVELVLNRLEFPLIKKCLPYILQL